MINVFVIDDSAVVRTAISSLVEKEPDIHLVGVAQDPLFAMDKFQRQGWPDVIILDIEMPRMDGLTFLKKIMATRPTPVIICSSIAQDGSRSAIEALSIGAIEVIGKPEFKVKNFFEEVHERFAMAIRAAAKSKLKPALTARNNFLSSVEERKTADALLPKLNRSLNGEKIDKIIAIGSSTGGVQVLEAIITKLPAFIPPILITQHMPAGFTASFADRLDRLSQVNVKEAVDGEVLASGTIYIAPGDTHLMIKRHGSRIISVVKDGPKVSRHKPSVDVLFRSCANEVGSHCTAFILTGMGDDGARGMKELFDKGSKTYAQDERSCVVYGMPKEAVAHGGVSKTVTPTEVVEIIKGIQ